ncbi:MAG: hypothetical protein HYR87_03205, partial [Thaumarchaeota archaeon]|nr:hypothetical protein [Nitrososphaerota archaeon]
FDLVLKEHPKNGNVIYAKSRSKAEIGEIDDSLILLAEAISYYGKTIKNWAIKDKSFKSIKDDLRFRALVK